MYGVETIRFAGDGVAISAASWACGSQACGFRAATSENRDHSAAIRSRCSSRPVPSRARSAVSNSA